MAILSFGFTKIDVEKKSKVTKQVNIKSNMNITTVEASDMVSGTQQKAFKIGFSYETIYEPKVGHISLGGELMYLADEKLAKEINDTWDKKKALPKDIALKIFNKILHHSNVEALILSREINLPPPIQLPKVKQGAAVEKKK